MQNIIRIVLILHEVCFTLASSTSDGKNATANSPILTIETWQLCKLSVTTIPMIHVKRREAASSSQIDSEGDISEQRSLGMCSPIKFDVSTVKENVSTKGVKENLSAKNVEGNESTKHIKNEISTKDVEENMSSKHAWKNVPIKNLSLFYFKNDIPQRSSLVVKRDVGDSKVSVVTDLTYDTLQETETDKDVLSEESLRNLLLYIVSTYMKDCFLTVTYGEEVNDSELIENLLKLSNTKQLIKVSGDTDFSVILWKSQQCRGFVFLQQNLDFFHRFADLNDLVWDFQGRYVVIGPSKESLANLFSARKMKNTENVIGVTKSSRKGEWVIYTNWDTFKGQMSFLGTWKIDHFPIRQPELFPDKLKNFHGRPLKVATFEFRPIIFYEWYDDGTVRDRYGQDVMLARELTRVLNGSIEFLDVSLDEKWGDIFPNGSWNGLNGFLQRGDTDIGICGFFMTMLRAKIMQFTHPYTRRASRVLLQKSKTLPKWERILYPFELSTWISVSIGLVISGGLLYALVKVAQLSGGEKSDLQSISYAYLYTTGMHFMEGQPIAPKSRGLQIFISFMWIYAIVISTGYTSNLMALLTVSRSPKSIDTFEQFYLSGKGLYGAGNIYRRGLEDSKSPYMQGLVKRFTAYRTYTKEILDKLMKGEIGILANEAALMYIVQMNLTNKGYTPVRFMRESFTSYNIGLATPKGSPLTEKFNDVINNLVKGGIIDYWFKESLKRAKEASNREERKRNDGRSEEEKMKQRDEEKVVDGAGDGVQPLGIGHMEGFFFILIVGVLASSVAFGFEKLMAK